MEKNLKPIGELLVDSWRLYKKHMNVFALISVIPFIFAGVKMALAPYLYNFIGLPSGLAALSLLGIFGLLYLLFVVMMPFAVSVAVCEADRGDVPNANAVYKRAFTSIIPYLTVVLLMLIVCLGGSILFIIPGIIVSIYLSLAMYVYIFEGKTNIDALVTSAWYVRNFWWDIIARKVVFAVLAFIAMFVFSVIFIPIILAGGFSMNIFQFLFDLFIFMIIVPFSLTGYYLIYKDVKRAQHARGNTATPAKVFFLESEKIFVIFIIVAAVAAVVVFCVFSLEPQSLSMGMWHQSALHYGTHYGVHGANPQNYQFYARPY